MQKSLILSSLWNTAFKYECDIIISSHIQLVFPFEKHTQSKYNITVKLDNTPEQHVDHPKNLEITLDRTLTLKQHLKISTHESTLCGN
jgi:hypothetical protein